MFVYCCCSYIVVISMLELLDMKIVLSEGVVNKIRTTGFPVSCWFTRFLNTCLMELNGAYNKDRQRSSR